MDPYNSAPIKVIVEEQTFYVHEKLLTGLSKPFRRMLTGGMKESTEKEIKLPDVTATTFNMFLEWLYKGYYTMPKPTKDKPKQHEEASPSRPISPNLNFSFNGESAVVGIVSDDFQNSSPKMADDGIDNDWGSFGSKRKASKKKKSAKRAHSPHSLPLRIRNQSKRNCYTFQHDFKSAQYTEFSSSIPILGPRSNEPSEVFTEVFLGHARLYVFAEKWEIPRLDTLAWETLQETLKNFELSAACTDDVVALFEYVYGNTRATIEVLEYPTEGRDIYGDGKIQVRMDPMRAMLIDYLGWQMDALIRNPGFATLIVRDGGALMEDFLEVVARRI